MESVQASVWDHHGDPNDITSYCFAMHLSKLLVAELRKRKKK